ncbi:DUF302 domain-containing protein [Nitratiruptor sp. SB155-2]|uniref:DUF302 domain-containing protein n=1 Tax=Nitratiruptor sp. (strain SB155-2) TaxID=387092 RepID=UPI0001586F13|nr:DUF302 domain-containing protein [Nitratiruptor sp. SB155-2]BAF69249.1 conserved hypothetical protein [Nitratiruptor sp. SB155-2]
MIYKTTTKTLIDKVKEELPDKAKTFGFGILGSYDFQQILKKKGYDLKTQITVYELCNPPAAFQALTTINEISVFLPCRLSIYKENEETVLATIGIENILEAVQADEVLKKHMNEIFSNLRSLMSSF